MLCVPSLWNERQIHELLWNAIVNRSYRPSMTLQLPHDIHWNFLARFKEELYRIETKLWWHTCFFIFAYLYHWQQNVQKCSTIMQMNLIIYLVNATEWIQNNGIWNKGIFHQFLKISISRAYLLDFIQLFNVGKPKFFITWEHIWLESKLEVFYWRGLGATRFILTLVGGSV